MFTFKASAMARPDPADSATLAQQHTRSLQQRLDQPAFTTAWNNLPAQEEMKVIKLLAFGLNDRHGDGVGAHETSRFLMGKSGPFSGNTNLQPFTPSPRTQDLMASVLKTGSHANHEKAADKLDALLGNLLNRVAIGQAWHQFLFEQDHDSALHRDLATSGLSEATKKSIHLFKMRQLKPPTQRGAGHTSKDVDEQFHRTLYAAAFKGQPLPLAGNAAFFTDYVLDTLRTRPDKFGMDSLSSGVISAMVEDAFIHLDASTPRRAELRQALLSLENGGLDQLLVSTSNPAIRKITRHINLAVRDLAFHGASDHQAQLQQRIISRVEEQIGYRVGSGNISQLLDLLTAPSNLRHDHDDTFYRKLPVVPDDGAAAASMRYRQALVHRIEQEILARPATHYGMETARKVLDHYLVLLWDHGELRHQQTRAMEPTIFRLMANDVLRDPDDLHALAGHLRSGLLSLLGARPAIAEQGLDFLTQFCSFHRIALLSLLSKNDNLGALTPAQLRRVLLDKELLIPASLQQAENHLSAEVKSAIKLRILASMPFTISQPALLQPMADHIKQVLADIYGVELPDAAARQLIPRLAQLHGRQRVETDIEQALAQVATLQFAPVQRPNALLRLTVASLELKLALHLDSLTPHADLRVCTEAAQAILHGQATPDRFGYTEPAGFSLAMGVLQSTLCEAVQSALASGAIQRGALDAVKHQIASQFSNLQNDTFLSNAAGVIMATGDQKNKVRAVKGLMVDVGDQHMFYDMESGEKQALAEKLANLDGPAIMAASVQRLLTDLWPLLAHADPADMRQTAEQILEYKQWATLVAAKAAANNHFTHDISEFAQRLRSAPADADRDVAHDPAVWAALIERTLPFLNPAHLRRLLAAQRGDLAEEMNSKLAFAEQYFKDIDADPADLDETPLKAFVIGKPGAHHLLAVDELAFLHPHNIRGKEAQHFSLRAPALGGNGRWIEEPLRPADVRQMDLPKHIRRAMIANHAGGSDFDDAVLAALLGSGECQLTLSEKEQNGLRLCCHKMATNFDEALPSVFDKKSDLRLRTGDVALEVEFTQLRSALLKPELPASSMSLHQLTAARNNPTANLATRLIAKMERQDALAPMAQALQHQATSLALTYRQHVAQHEIYFLLGLMFLRLSSTDGLGFHVGAENQSFVRRQIMGNYCLAKCLTESDASATAAGLTPEQKSHLLQTLKTASTTGTCTGIISNSLGQYAPDYMRPLMQRGLNVLRLAALGE